MKYAYSLLLLAGILFHTQCLAVTVEKAIEISRTLPPDVKEPNIEAMTASGDTLAVSYSATGADRKGAVYVFVRQEGTWVQQARLTEENGKYGKQYGCSLSIWKDTLIVGACNDGAHLNGVAYLYERHDGTWTQTARLDDTEQLDGGIFMKVAVQADTAIVTRPSIDAGFSFFRQPEYGVAYEFDRINGKWKKKDEFKPSPGVQNGGKIKDFGDGLAFSGSTAAICSLTPPGAFVFSRNACGWTQQDILIPRELIDVYGSKCAPFLSASGDEVVLAYPYLHKLFAFARTNDKWEQESSLENPDLPQSNLYGYNVSFNHDTILASDPNQGVVYMFKRNDGIWDKPKRIIAGLGNGQKLGSKVLLLEHSFITNSVGGSLFEIPLND